MARGGPIARLVGRIVADRIRPFAQPKPAESVYPPFLVQSNQTFGNNILDCQTNLRASAIADRIAGGAPLARGRSVAAATRGVDRAARASRRCNGSTPADID